MNNLQFVSVSGVVSCVICKKDEADRQVLGKLYIFREAAVHLLCAVTSSKLDKYPEYAIGIKGIPSKHILNTVSKVKDEICEYCKETGAALHCNYEGCTKKFHLPCGIKEGSLISYGELKCDSYCSAHRKYQDVPELAFLRGEEDCIVCFDKLKCSTNSTTALWAPCCNKRTWLHRDCAQTLAWKAGGFFKCPTCNDMYIFRREMMEHGIYVPLWKDSWNRYHEDEILELIATPPCSAVMCLCIEGRSYNEAGADQLVRCSFCGSTSVHRRCGRFKENQQGWTCDSCKIAEHESGPVSSRMIFTPKPPHLLGNYKDDGDPLTPHSPPFSPGGTWPNSNSDSDSVEASNERSTTISTESYEDPYNLFTIRRVDLTKIGTPYIKTTRSDILEEDVEYSYNKSRIWKDFDEYRLEQLKRTEKKASHDVAAFDVGEGEIDHFIDNVGQKVNGLITIGFKEINDISDCAITHCTFLPSRCNNSTDGIMRAPMYILPHAARKILFIPIQPGRILSEVDPNAGGQSVLLPSSDQMDLTL